MSAGMVIIGGGECGARAALGLRERGHDGPITLVGEEIHLPYERPPLSKAVLLDGEIPPPKWIAEAERFTDLGIELRTGVLALELDRDAREVHLSDRTHLRYDKLLLATGAEPRRFPAQEGEAPPILYLRNHDEALALRDLLVPGIDVVVIGGGFIGLELAAAATQRGGRVTVIEAQERLLKRGVPAEIAEILAARHRAEGVDLILSAGIAAIQPDAIRLEDGRRIPAGLIIAGIGASPRTALAARAGLNLDNGIAVDATLATADASIFAAGDCCSFPHPLYGDRRIRLESWRSAQEQGALAAANMLGAAQPVSAVPWFWSDQYDLGLQIAGLAEGATTEIRRQQADGSLVLFHLDADGRLLAASGIGPGNAVARDIRVAEMLIGRRARPDQAALAAPDFKLKQLLAA